MTSPDRLDPLAFIGSFAELESDLPPGMTLQAWRSERNRPAAPASRIGRGGAGADLVARDLGQVHRSLRHYLRLAG